MGMMKVLSILLGVLLIVGGIYCMATPAMTFMTLGWLLGIFMLVSSMSTLFGYSQRKALGAADGWTLVGAIITLLLSIFLLASNTMQFLTNVILAYTAGAWIIVMGVVRIATAMKIHKLRQMLPEESRGSVWLWMAILGVLLLIMGVLSLLHPIMAMMGIGMMMGLVVLFSGINLISISLFMPDV